MSISASERESYFFAEVGQRTYCQSRDNFPPGQINQTVLLLGRVGKDWFPARNGPSTEWAKGQANSQVT